MRTLYNYAILVKNTPENKLQQESTLLPNKWKKSKYALILKSCYSDGMEAISKIIYFNDLERTIEQMKTFVSWYDYVNGFSKSLNGVFSEVPIQH